LRGLFGRINCDANEAALLGILRSSSTVTSAQQSFSTCAAASSRKLPILTTDVDFKLYAQYVPIQLLLNG
jgi:hypothetical protein